MTESRHRPPYGQAWPWNRDSRGPLTGLSELARGGEEYGQGTRQGRRADKIKGAVKDAVGSATGNEKLQAEGKADKAEGTAREAAGDVKDAGRNVADAVKR